MLHCITVDAILVSYQSFCLTLGKILHERPLCVRQSFYQQSFVVSAISILHSIIFHSGCFIFCGRFTWGSWSSKPTTIRAGLSWWENAHILKLYTYSCFNLNIFMYELYRLSITKLFTMNLFAECSVCVSNKLANIWFENKSWSWRHHLLGMKAGSA